MTAPWTHRQLLCGQKKLKWDSVFFLSTRRVSLSEIDKWHQNLRLCCLWLIFWNYCQCFWLCEPVFLVCVQQHPKSTHQAGKARHCICWFNIVFIVFRVIYFHSGKSLWGKHSSAWILFLLWIRVATDYNISVACWILIRRFLIKEKFCLQSYDWIQCN